MKLVLFVFVSSILIETLLAQSNCSPNLSTCASCPNTLFNSNFNAICTSCQAGSYLVSSSTCKSCSQNCINCLNSGLCTSCIAGYVLIQGICISCSSNSINYLGVLNCAVCSISNNQNKISCSTCLPGFALINNTCISCISGDPIFSGGILGITNCINCNIQCLLGTCSINCNVCNSGYNNSVTSCKYCSLVTGCSQCLGNTCVACPLGYTSLNNSCSALTSIHATNCFIQFSLPGMCTTCNPQYYLEPTTSTCLPCTAPCQNCSNAINCLSCIQGYYLVGQVCLFCSSAPMNITGNIYMGIANCQSCNAPAGQTYQPTCNSCINNYALSTKYNVCLLCPNNCQVCYALSDTNTTICTMCSNNTFLTSDGICNFGKAIDPLCYIANATNTCLQCSSGYFLTTPFCGSCPEGCISCTNKSLCNACANGYNISYNGICIKYNLFNLPYNWGSSIWFNYLLLITIFLYFLK